MDTKQNIGNTTSSRIYISLPIKGYDIEERIMYAKVVENMLAKKFGEKTEIVNPLKDVTVKNADSMSYERYLGKDIEELSTCDTAVFCPKYENSHGCLIEYWFSMYASKTILILDDEMKLHKIRYRTI